MKKLYIAVAMAAALGVNGATAGGDKHKDKQAKADNSEPVKEYSYWDKIGNTFKELDNDEDGFISREEADDDDIELHFAQIDQNDDKQLSADEYNQYLDAYGEKVATRGTIEDHREERNEAAAKVAQNEEPEIEQESEELAADIEEEGDELATGMEQESEELAAEIDEESQELENETEEAAAEAEAEWESAEAEAESEWDSAMNEEADPTAENMQELHEEAAEAEEDMEYDEDSGQREYSYWDKIDNNFAELDNDEDGQISVEEADDDDIELHFVKIDTDKSGSISKQEYDTYLNEQGSKVATDDLLQERREAGEGQEEIAQADQPEEQPKQFAELDSNADGKVSMEEAQSDQQLSASFSEADEDGDGELSSEEYQEFQEDK